MSSNELGGHFVVLGCATLVFICGLIGVVLEGRTPAGVAAMTFGGGLFLALVWIGFLLIDIRDALREKNDDNTTRIQPSLPGGQEG